MMTTAPTLVPDPFTAQRLHFVLCDFGQAGVAFVETLRRQPMRPRSSRTCSAGNTISRCK